MHSIEQTAGQVIAADTQNSVAAIDQTVMSYARLCASIVEVSGASNLPVTTCQKALASMAEGLVNAVAGRQNVADATRELLKAQRASSLQPVSFGCPDGLQSLVTGSSVIPVEKQENV